MQRRVFTEGVNVRESSHESSAMEPVITDPDGVNAMSLASLVFLGGPLGV